jgi:hypothetical protein
MLTILLMCSTSNATTKIETNLVRPEKELIEPESFIVTNNQGQKFVGYSLDDAKKVGHVFLDYHLLWSYSIALEAENASLKRENEFLAQSNNLWQGMSDEFKRRGDAYLASWQTEQQLTKRLQTERETRSRYAWVPWALTAVCAVSLAILIPLK